MAGLDSGTVEACLRLLGEEVRFLVADSPEESLRLLSAQPVAVLALGAAISGEQALRLIEEADTLPEGERRVNLVLAGGPDPSLFQELIDRDRVFYLSQEPVPAPDLIALLKSATARWRSASREDEAERRRAAFVRRVFAAAQTLATQREPKGLARAAAEAVEELVRADRGYCLLYDKSSDTLWEPPRDEDLEEERRETAAVGLVSFVLRTGRPLRLDHLSSDPRFDREADDPRSQGNERFLSVPVPSPDGRVLAVLAAVRTAAEAPFSDIDLQALTLLAEQSAAAFAHLGLAEGSREGLPASALFREEAVEFYQVGLKSEGDLLRVDPGWMRWTYRLLLAALVVGLLFGVFARVREYASGPAVVRLAGRSDLTATADGTVSQITVAPGQRVQAGDLLVRFYGAREAAELARIDNEMELQLVNRLRDPSDAGAEQGLISLRAQRELARSNLAEREVRAAASGVVSDLRVRVGQRILPGQTLLSISRGGERPDAESLPRVVALLPGEFRPLLKPGMPLRLELQGYRYAYQHLVVDSVGDEVVGPEEAERYLGNDVAGGAPTPITGPVVRVEAHLTSDSFEAEGHRRRYHDGMWGKAEVRVRSERVVVALVPALKAFLEAREGGDA